MRGYYSYKSCVVRRKTDPWK